MLSHWFDYFPKKNFLIIDANDIKHNPINAIQKVEYFVGIDHFLNESNFEKQPDTGMYCMRLEKDGECKIPGGNKGRTVHKSIPEISQKQLRRFFRAIEGDNEVL